MFKLLTKIVFSFFVAVVIFNSTIAINVAHAQTTAGQQWYNSSFTTWYGKVYDTNVSPSNEIFGERYTAAQVQWVIYSLWAFMINAVTGPENSSVIACIMKGIGEQVFSISGCVPAVPLNGTPYLTEPKPIAQSGSLMEAVFARRSISGVWYFKDRIDSFSLVPSAHAQVVGFGFDALSPIQPMWKVVRDISFSLFAVVAVVFAFMVMFRVKLSPQTVITVQSALPKLVVSLILVTFSYAIAGFMIDFMYVIIGLISVIGSRFYGAINLAGTNFTAVGMFNFLVYGQPFGLNIQLGVLPMMMFYISSWFVMFLIVFLTNIGLMIAGPTLLLGWPVLIILGLLIGIIAAILVLWHAVRTIWELIKSFANIILLTILAPLQITLGTFIPNYGFNAWMRSYFSALSTFIVVGTMMMFAYLFMYIGVITAVAGLVTVPGGAGLENFLYSGIKIVFGQTNPANPFTGNANGWPPLLGQGNAGWTGLIFLAVSFVMFTMIPKATDVVEAFIQGKRFGYGSAIGESLGPINTAWAYTGGAILNEARRDSRLLQQVWTDIKKASKKTIGQQNDEGGSTGANDR